MRRCGVSTASTVTGSRVLRNTRSNERAANYPTGVRHRFVGAALAAPFSLVGRNLLAAIVAAYAVANIGATLSVARRQKLTQPWALPFAFAAMHIGYGFGFLTGLVKFWNRWRDPREVVSRVAGVINSPHERTAPR